MDELDWIERRALESWHRAADEGARKSAGLDWVELGGGFASIAAKLPASAIVANRAISLGMARPARREEIAELVSLYRDRGVARYFAHVHPEAAPPELGAWLMAESLEQARGWMKFARRRAAPPEMTTDLTIAEIGPEHAAFDLGDSAIPWITRLVGGENWRAFGAFDGDMLAAVGGLYVEDGIGWCDFGATAPAFRRRGAQSALLAHRVGAALDLGCRIIGTCTGEAVPGDPQHSYSSILKMGFEERYIRLNYAPPRA
jgi:GNAT superfamily N-acetyltransferase